METRILKDKDCGADTLYPENYDKDCGGHFVS